MLYCYTTKSGKTVERSFPIGKSPMFVVFEGKRAYRDFVAEQRQVRDTPGAWPMFSGAAAVHPSQIPQAIEAAKLHGVNIEFSKTGEPKFESPNHRKRYLRTRKIFDRNAGYGDPVPD